MYPQYMCILLYVLVISGVTVFQRSTVNCEFEGVDVSSVYVHSLICDTYFV